MNLRFTITDNITAVSTEIDEPVGWDGIALRMKRDKIWHGFFDFADDSVSSLQFIDSGFSLLKAAYEADGAQANCSLLVEVQCADGDSYDQLYLGRFVFSSYKETCGDECVSEIGVEALDCLMVFRNRYDQQVDLDSLFSFDLKCEDRTIEVSEAAINGAAHEIFTNDPSVTADMYPGMEITITDTALNNGTFTVEIAYPDGTIKTVESLVNEAPTNFHISGCFRIEMEPYTGLNFPVQLPSKIVQLKNDWGINPDGGGTYFYTDTLLNSEAIGTTGYYLFPFEWDINRVTEITDSYPFRDEFQIIPGPIPPFSIFTSETPGLIQLNLQSALRCIGETEITVEMTGEVSLNTSDTVQFSGNIILYWGNDTDGYSNAILQAGFGCAGCGNATNPININYTNTIFLAQGDKIYLGLVLANFQYTTGGGGGGPSDPFELTIDVDSATLRVTTDTECESTVCNVYKINETMSRCVEAYTNDCMRVYSDYFGRIDAQPYPSDVDGCGGQRSIANGKKIRNAPNTDGATPIKMTVSMKDTFEALNATDNIGMGLETDPNRPGFNLIRVEPVNYFFNDTVLMTCRHIRKVRKVVDSALIFSVYKGGYEKWETWNDNGLYDLFGDREYRTELSELSNTLQQVCRWIASDYAIEFTRRLYGTTTSDWKYDDDIFFLCFKPCWTGDVGFNTLTDFIQINENGIYNQIQAGDTIVISGSSTGNDGTYTVDVVEEATQDSLIFGVVESFPGSAGEDTITICNETMPFTVIETGLDNPSNILFPETVMNYRIAPSRNAMRWFKTLLQSYRTFEEHGIKFTQGGGNILAQGEVLDADGCRLENAVIQEQRDISLDDFIYQELNIPKFYPELIEFEYPMSYEEYLVVKANPYGLVQYQCGNGPFREGWIEDMQYSPYEGIVKFVLRPKISIDDCELCLLTEFGTGLLTEDSQELIEET